MLEVIIVRRCGEDKLTIKREKKEMAYAIKKCDSLYSLDGEKISATNLELLVNNQLFDEYKITYITEYDEVRQKSYSRKEFYGL